MKRKLLTYLLLIFFASNAHAGAAICIKWVRGTPNSPGTDIDYMVKWDSSSYGTQIQSELMKECYEKYGYSLNSSDFALKLKSSWHLINGYFLIIKDVRKNDNGKQIVTYAFGHGESREKAEEMAFRELSIRSLFKWKEGDEYTVEKAQEF